MFSDRLSPNAFRFALNPSDLIGSCLFVSVFIDYYGVCFVDYYLTPHEWKRLIALLCDGSVPVVLVVVYRRVTDPRSWCDYLLSCVCNWMGLLQTFIVSFLTWHRYDCMYATSLYWAQQSDFCRDYLLWICVYRWKQNLYCLLVSVVRCTELYWVRVTKIWKAANVSRFVSSLIIYTVYSDTCWAIFFFVVHLMYFEAYTRISWPDVVWFWLFAVVVLHSTVCMVCCSCWNFLFQWTSSVHFKGEFILKADTFPESFHCPVSLICYLTHLCCSFVE